MLTFLKGDAPKRVSFIGSFSSRSNTTVSSLRFGTRSNGISYLLFLLFLSRTAKNCHQKEFSYAFEGDLLNLDNVLELGGK